MLKNNRFIVKKTRCLTEKEFDFSASQFKDTSPVFRTICTICKCTDIGVYAIWRPLMGVKEFYDTENNLHRHDMFINKLYCKCSNEHMFIDYCISVCWCGYEEENPIYGGM